MSVCDQPTSRLATRLIDKEEHFYHKSLIVNTVILSCTYVGMFADPLLYICIQGATGRIIKDHAHTTKIISLE